jgi:glutamine amidotransferase
MISIINYGVGNVGAISNMLTFLRIPNKITSDESEIIASSGIILPGVGSFDNAMTQLNSQASLIESIKIFAEESKRPVLGICLGMQIMARVSEEGIIPGLGWINAQVCKFSSSKNVKVPNMGWRDVKIEKNDLLFSGLPISSKFYFSHSYYMTVNQNYSIMSSQNGGEFSAAFRSENIYGVQFHPEKSHSYGMKILSNFARISNG